MTRKGQIHKASLRVYRGFGRDDLRSAFEVGARWADRHQPSPWISVEDRLPEAFKYKPVLVSYEVNEVDGTVGHDCCAAILNGQNDWTAFGCNVQNAKINAKVTHWMPIPELPQINDK